MNILFFHSQTIAPICGGIERATKTLADEFAARGNGVFYLGAKKTWEEHADRERQFFLPNVKKLSANENAEFFERFLTEKKIDVIAFQWADGKRFPFPQITKRLGVPVVAAIHTDPCFYEKRFRGNALGVRIKRALRFRRQKKIYRGNAKCCATTALLSEAFSDGFLKHFPRGAKPNFCAIPNPSAYENTGADISPKKKELLFVGRMEMSVKQPQLLLKIWRKLQERFPDWSLRMVGGGYDFEEIKALAGTLGVERAHFEGFKNPQPYYRDAAIFCMTSAYEGFGMVLVEAASFGCVPVAFRSFSSVSDIIADGENGVLVPAFDTDIYAEKLAALMSDDAARERLARNALRDVARFAKSKIAERWLNLFKFISESA